MPPGNLYFGAHHSGNPSFAMLCFYKPCTLQLHCIFQAQMPLVPPLNRSMPSPWTLLFWSTILEKSKLPNRISHLLPTATRTLFMKKKPKFYMEMPNLLCFLCNLQNNLFKALLQCFSLEHQKSMFVIQCLSKLYHSWSGKLQGKPTSKI